jgi:hypothetical protein
MTNTGYLSLQANIICLLLALIGITVIVEHPAWFGRVPQTASSAWEFGVPAEWRRSRLMVGISHDYDPIVDFWQWYRRREEQRLGPLADYALDKCEETFKRCEWTSFGHWHAIYLRQRWSEHKAHAPRRIDW